MTRGSDLARAAVTPVLLLAIAAVSQTGVSLAQQGTGVLAVFLRDRDHLGLAAMGGLVSASTIGMMVGNVPGGRVLDRVGTSPVVAFCGLVAAALLTLLALHLPAYSLLFAVFAALGILYGPTGIGGARAVFRAFPPERRGLAMGIRQTGVPFGAALAAALLPLLVGGLGLRLTFGFLAVVVAIPTQVLAWASSRAPGVRTGAGALPRLKGPGGAKGSEGSGDPAAPAAQGQRPHGTRPQGDGPAAAAAADRSGWGRTLRAVALPCVVGALLSAGQYDVLTYTIVDLHATAALGLDLAGIVLAVAQVGGATGRVLFGWLSDRGRWGRARYTAGVAAGGVAVFGTLAVWHHLPGWMLFPLFLLVGGAAAGWNALIIVWAAEASGPDAAGLGMGASATSVFVGASIFAPLFGVIVTATGSYGPGWAMVAVAYAVAALLAGGAGRARRKGPAGRASPGGAAAPS